LSFSEAREMQPEIAKHSELGEFLAMPIHTYSTGMYLRLAFSISTSVTPDILILDEMVGAGDAKFQKKVKERVDGLLSSTKILFLSSHDLALVERYCDQVIWLEKGSVLMQGEMPVVLPKYKESIL
jgi:ABC-type polysaccharide/polyol phosphate transport system ATPase subunit